MDYALLGLVLRYLISIHYSLSPKFILITPSISYAIIILLSFNFSIATEYSRLISSTVHPPTPLSKGD